GASAADGAVVGRLSSGAATQVNVANLPTSFATNAWNHGPLLRNGQFSGSQLPSAPASGQKPGAPGVPQAPEPRIVATGFNGIGLSTSNCGCAPPDVNAAVGPNDIVETVNLEFAAYDKSGALLHKASLNNFFSTPD